MNRVVLDMDEQGLFTVYSDEPIAFFTVCNFTPNDRVYQMKVQVGVEKVRDILGDDPVGHIGDEYLETGSQYGKKPVSGPTLKVIK